MDTQDIQSLKEYIVGLLSALIKRKEDKQMFPYTISMIEIQQAAICDIKQALNELCREQVLTFHRTLNDISFEFTPPK